MSLKILHLPLIIFLVMAISCISSGQDSKPNLIIPGIWETPESNEINEKYAEALDAKYIPAYSSGSKIFDVDSVDSATPTIMVTFKDPLTGDVIPVTEVRAIDADYGKVERNIKDPSTGAIISYARYFADEINGLTDERLNPSKDGVGDHYGTIYVHSGGARTAVTALLYQGVTADRLVLISPARGTQDQEDYNKDLQRLLDLGIVKEIVVYQSEADTPTAKGIWKGEFKEGDVKGNFKIIPVSKEELLGKTGDDAHIQMWETALSKDSQAIKDLLLEEKSYKPIPKSLLKKEFLASLTNPLLSPYSASYTSGFSSQNKEGTDVSETSGVSYFDQANDVWYIDAYSWTGSKSLYDKPAAPRRFVSGELNTIGYNWVSLPYSRTGMTYDQGYFNWCAETLASMGQSAPTAGYGLLIDEGQNGGGGW